MRRLRWAEGLALLCLAVSIPVTIEAVFGEFDRFKPGDSAITPLLSVELLAMAVLAGFLGALMGLGGGIVMVPMLTSVFNLPIHEAVAISIVGVVATGISGGSAYLRQKMTNIRLAMFLETSTTLGALTGALLALMIPGTFLYLIFSAFAFYVSISQVRSIKLETKKIRLDGFKKATPDRLSRVLNLSGSYFDKNLGTDVGYVVRGSIPGWLVSFMAGMGSGLLGIGGGFIKVSAMNLFMNVPLKASIATSKFMISVTAATSAMVYFLYGAVRLSYAAPVAIGTTLGASLGAKVMNRLKVKWLKAVFASITCYLGYNMLRKGLLLSAGINLP